jgi:hypothetical protein
MVEDSEYGDRRFLFNAGTYLPEHGISLFSITPRQALGVNQPSCKIFSRG